MMCDKSRNICGHCGRQAAGTWDRPVCFICREKGLAPKIIFFPFGEWSQMSPAERLAYAQSDQYRLDTAETPEKRREVEREIAAKNIGQPTPIKRHRKKRH